MMIRFFFISCFVAVTCLANGQTVIVNPDGTHTVVTGSEQAGSPKVVVHPNGQHSTVHTTGAHTVVVGPDGRHTVVVGADQQSPKIIVHPGGKHSVVLSTGAHSIVVGPDGAHAVMVKQLLPLLRVNIPVPVQGPLPAALQDQLAMVLVLFFMQ